MPKTVIKYSPSLLPPMPRLRPRVLNIFQMENWKTDSAVTWQQLASVRTTDNAQEPGFGIKPLPKSGCKLCLGNLFSCVGAYHYLRPWMLRSCHHIYFEPNVITAYCPRTWCLCLLNAYLNAMWFPPSVLLVIFLPKKDFVLLWHEGVQDCSSHCSGGRGWGKNKGTALCNALSAQGLRTRSSSTTCRIVGALLLLLLLLLQEECRSPLDASSPVRALFIDAIS